MLRVLCAFVLGVTCSVAVVRFDDVKGHPYSVKIQGHNLVVNSASSNTANAAAIKNAPSLFLAGSIHYPRLMPSMWDDVLAEAKTQGLTMITVYVFRFVFLLTYMQLIIALYRYVFWNFHEPLRGEVDFKTGRKNLPLFLQKAADHGLFVYLRPG